jgi:hypothetical protein
MTTPPDPDPREAADQAHPGGLIEGGPQSIPGVQDRGPADADAEQEDGAAPVTPADED